MSKVGNPSHKKALFSIAATLKCRGGRDSFPKNFPP